jgi:Ca2+-binding RTX toxin-like protein
MASFTVNNGVTDPTAKTVSNNDTGTIAAGGTLSDTTDITWTGGSAAPGVVIDNFGTITATTRAIDTSGNFTTGSFTLDNEAGARLIASGNDAFRINTNISNGIITVDNSGLLVSGAVDAQGHVIAHASGQALDFAAITSPTAFINITNNAGATIGSSGDDAIRPGAGHIHIDNSGLIDATASGSRAINLNAASLSNVVSFELDNHQGGTIQSQGDTVRITATTLTGNPAGSFALDNAGTIQSTGVGGNNGQAIDFNDLVSTNGHVTITNEATGLIQAADADAVRAGTNATVNNLGTIKSLNGTPTSTGNDGLDFQGNTGDIVNNGDVTHTAALISGARHGITGDNPVTVTNYGEIIGNSGSGINLDTISTTTTSIKNHGTIIGTSVNGDGDGVDVDGLIALDNFGMIQAAGVSIAGEVQEGVTIGGGTINNFAGAVIQSFERAITVDDSNLGNAFAPTIIYNEGKIEGDDGQAISITDTFADTITNKGMIIGSVATGGGDDIINLYAGSSMSGLLDGGAGTDTINLLGTGTGTLSNVANAEILDVQGGHWTVSDDETFVTGTTIAVGATLQVGNGGAAGTLTSDVADSGRLAFDHAGTFTFGNLISGSGTVEQAGSGTLVLSGHNSYGGGTEIASGTLDVVASDSAGTGAITFDPGVEALHVELTALSSNDFANVIVGFASGDTVDLAGIGLATGATLGPNNVLTVTGGSAGPVTLHLDPGQDFTGKVFTTATDHAGGTIIGVDDAPVFTSGADFSILENTTAVGSVTAVDPEHDTFAFSLTGGTDESFFSIDAHTGALKFVASPDFETPADANHDNIYDVIVTATDSHGAVSMQDISVHVTDVVEIGKTINGTNGNDTLTGTTGDDIISGGNGNDRIDGGDGNDNISGGNGNDVLIGGRGNNTIDGGNGNDTIIAADGNNTITGGNGNETVTVGNGNNSFVGGNGNDNVVVGNGNNVLTGGNGNDTFHVGAGNNILTGGSGNDTFVFAANLGKDVVTDFNHGDTIEFDGVFQNFQAVLAASHQVGADTVIALDAQHSVTLQHVTLTSLHASDFHLA